MGLFLPGNLRQKQQPARGETPAILDDVEFDLPPLEQGKSYKNKYGGKSTVNEDGSVDIELEADKPGGTIDPNDHDANLAEVIEDFELGAIAETLLLGIQGDITSRGEMEDMSNKALEMCGLKLESITDGSEGTVSKVHHTLLMEAVVRYQSNAGAELLPAAGPVKVRDDTAPDAIKTAPVMPPPMLGHNGGPPIDDASLGLPPPIPGMAEQPPGMEGAPPEGMPGAAGIGGPDDAQGLPPEILPQAPEIDRNALAQALEDDMNHYLTVVAKEYYPDYYRMLFAQALLGCAFKKIYDCPLRRRPVSDYISSLDLIVSNDATDLYTAGRVTHRTKMRQNVMKRMQILGVYRDIILSIPVEETPETEKKVKQQSGIAPTTNSPLPADQQYTLYESYTELDLPGFENPEGLPLPYRVTIEKESRKILEIRRNWKEGDETFTPRRRFVKYGLVPGLGFYDYGYMHLLGNATRALTAAERMMLDAGMFASFPGFLIADQTTRQNTNILRIKPGTGKGIVTNGLPIGDVVMPVPYKEPSQALAALAEGIAGDARALAGFIEIPTGEGVQNIPVGTMLAMIEQASKVMGAIHRRNHAAHQEELSILRELFAENPEALWKFADSPKRKWQVDMEFKDLKLVPASDPNVPSHIHRLMIGTALAQRADAKPDLYDAREVEERLLRILGMQDIEKLLKPPAQPGAGAAPNPEATKIAMESQAREKEQKNEIAQDVIRGNLKLKEKQIDVTDKAAERQNKLQIAGIKGSVDLKRVGADLHGQAMQISHDLAKPSLKRPPLAMSSGVSKMPGK